MSEIIQNPGSDFEQSNERQKILATGLATTVSRYINGGKSRIEVERIVRQQLCDSISQGMSGEFDLIHVVLDEMPIEFFTRYVRLKIANDVSGQPHIRNFLVEYLEDLI